MPIGICPIHDVKYENICPVCLAGKLKAGLDKPSEE
jgi:hypothetical protein